MVRLFTRYGMTGWAMVRTFGGLEEARVYLARLEAAGLPMADDRGMAYYALRRPE
jgi:hypothetical protein